MKKILTVLGLSAAFSFAAPIDGYMQTLLLSYPWQEAILKRVQKKFRP